MNDETGKAPLSAESLPRIALTMGDPAGIGPELILKAFLDEEALGRCAPVVVGEIAVFRRYAEMLGIGMEFIRVESAREARSAAGRMPVIEPEGSGAGDCLSIGRIGREHGAAAHRAIVEASRLAMRGDVDGIVTAPIHKESLRQAGVMFPGHTELLGHLAQSRQTAMLLAGGGLRVALATTHLPLKEVPAAITRGMLERTLRILHGDLQGKYGIAAPRILVAGLNPHAGEGGYLGREEIEIITPVLDALRAEGMRLSGPHPADTMFTPPVLAEGDAVLAMYHDQGLTALKYATFGHGINVTLGLPVIRTSVDHGTALELAGSGRADPGSLFEALAEAARMAARKAGAR